ncbi:MAG: ATP/GTP-binding protein [Chitinophagaceae bacterium]|nr:MAG: ATP/GTP-binding protein [Chitinophagaceae bacterium]
MKYFFTLVTLAISSLAIQAQHSLTQIWETDSTLKTPESVLFDGANKVLYVANIDGEGGAKDGKGSIGKVGLDGKIIAVDWVPGLQAPKGMAIVKNTLWVADIDEMVAIDIKAGKITQHVKIEGAKFLNDVAAAADGTVYVTDSHTKQLWKLDKGKPSKVLENLQGPNGVLVHNGSVHILDQGTLYKVGKDNSLQKLAEGMESSTDGLENVQGNEFLVSCWMGVVYYVKEDGSTEVLLDTRDQKVNSADIGYDAKQRIVYVPTFFKNKIVAYQLK